MPIATDHALGVAIISYHGRLTFGINADAGSAADVDVFARGLREALCELQRMAHALTA